MEPLLWLVLVFICFCAAFIILSLIVMLFAVILTEIELILRGVYDFFTRRSVNK